MTPPPTWLTGSAERLRPTDYPDSALHLNATIIPTGHGPYDMLSEGEIEQIQSSELLLIELFNNDTRLLDLYRDSISGDHRARRQLLTRNGFLNSVVEATFDRDIAFGFTDYSKAYLSKKPQLSAKIAQSALNRNVLTLDNLHSSPQVVKARLVEALELNLGRDIYSFKALARIVASAQKNVINKASSDPIRATVVVGYAHTANWYHGLNTDHSSADVYAETDGSILAAPFSYIANEYLNNISYTPSIEDLEDVCRESKATTRAQTMPTKRALSLLMGY